jgi:hypothetical protein
MKYQCFKLCLIFREDTYWGNLSDPLSLNLYAYVRYNPLRYWDPTGHWAAGDEQYHYYVQMQLLALTSAHYDAVAQEEKDVIGQAATALRNPNNINDNNATGGASAELMEAFAGLHAEFLWLTKNGNWLDRTQWNALLRQFGFTPGGTDPNGMSYDVSVSFKEKTTGSAPVYSSGRVTLTTNNKGRITAVKSTAHCHVRRTEPCPGYAAWRGDDPHAAYCMEFTCYAVRRGQSARTKTQPISYRP